MSKGDVMQDRYRTLTAIEYAFVLSAIASFGALGILGMFFGFQISRWSEWQAVLIEIVITIAGVIGAIFGVRMALHEESRI